MIMTAHAPHSPLKRAIAGLGLTLLLVFPHASFCDAQAAAEQAPEAQAPAPAQPAPQAQAPGNQVPTNNVAVHPQSASAADTGQPVTGPGSIIRATHGAWQVSCRTPPGAREEKCALVQSVTAEDRPNVGLTVVFYKAIGEDKKLLRVVVPLGVLLPTGLGLKINNQDVGNAPFLKCSRRGCVAEVVLQDEVIQKMKAGGTAMFIIFDTPESGIGIPISLEGFGAALAALK